MRTVTLKDGVILHLHDEPEALSNRIYREQDYFERPLLDYIQTYFPVHEVILDVGANIGNHTVYFAKYLKYIQIIAFEPIEENFKLLDLNTLDIPRLRLRNEAVGDGTLDVMMKKEPENMGACEVTPTGDIKAHQVRLDDLFVIPRVSLIKIDVEWYEPFVLMGAKDLIASDRPLILIEDAKQEFGDLLPSYYALLQSWPDERTYLYGDIHA